MANVSSKEVMEDSLVLSPSGDGGPMDNFSRRTVADSGSVSSVKSKSCKRKERYLDRARVDRRPLKPKKRRASKILDKHKQEYW